MSCSLTTGFAVGCDDSVGGVRRFLIGGMPSDFAATQNASGMATAISGTGLTYYAYETTNAQGAVSTFNDNAVVNSQNGTSFFDQTATYVLNKMEQVKRNEVKMIARAKMTVIVEDNNGKYWLMGQQNGVRLVSSESGTGAALGDRNGYSLSFQGQEFDNAPEVDPTIIAGLLV